MSYGTSNPIRHFGQQVRRARRAAGWTLTEFGQRIGYDPGQISRIENGKCPPAAGEWSRRQGDSQPDGAAGAAILAGERDSAGLPADG
jgi:hypothetical protein